MNASRFRSLALALAVLVSAALLAGLPAATAEPPLRCAGFSYASGATISGSRCTAATAALHNGRFKGPTDGVFGTAGWSSTPRGGRPHARQLRPARRIARFTA